MVEGRRAGDEKGEGNVACLHSREDHHQGRTVVGAWECYIPGTYLILSVFLSL